jgi:hypothetical protein
MRATCKKKGVTNKNEDQNDCEMDGVFSSRAVEVKCLKISVGKAEGKKSLTR